MGSVAVGFELERAAGVVLACGADLELERGAGPELEPQALGAGA